MQKVCRLCLRAEQRDVTPLFRDDIDDEECRQLRTQIADLCSIVVLQDDSFPKVICCKCRRRLQNAHEFVSLCKISNDKLQQHHEGNKNRTEDPFLLRKKKRKAAGRRNRECTAKSSLSTSVRKSSLRISRETSVNSDVYDSTSLRNVFNAEATESDDINENSEKNFNSTHATPLKEVNQVQLDDCCDEPSDNSKERYLCDVCSKTFASKSGLRFHLKSHYGSKPYACQFCEKSFIIPSYRKRHERTHTGNNFLICHICSTAFASSNGLKYHLMTHTGEANYHCSICGKSFVRRKYLQEHTFTHTGEKPFVCKLCGSAYGNSGTLFVHEKKCKLRHACNSEKNASETTAVMKMV